MTSSRFSRARTPLAIALALLLFVAIPSVASAQSPTDEQYKCGVVGVNSGGEECNDGTPVAGSSAAGGPGSDTSDTASPAADGNSGSNAGADTLPFTGLDVWQFAVLGLGLVATGFAVRRVGASS